MRPRGQGDQDEADREQADGPGGRLGGQPGGAPLGIGRVQRGELKGAAAADVVSAGRVDGHVPRARRRARRPLLVERGPDGFGAVAEPAVEFHDELAVGGRGKAGAGPVRVVLPPQLREERVGQRIARAGGWVGRRVGRAVGGRPVLQPKLDGLGLPAPVVGPEQGDQVGVGLVAGLLEPPLADVAVQGVPVLPVPGGPLLTGPRAAPHLVGDGLPGIADGPKFGGPGEQGVHVRTHGEVSGVKGWGLGKRPTAGERRPEN